MSTPEAVSLPVRLVLPEIPVECYAGTGLEFVVPVIGGDNLPVNAVNVISARAQVRTSYRSPEVFHSWTTDVPAGMELVTLGDDDNEAGVKIMATGAETATWQQQWPRLDMAWDLEVVDADGEPHRLCRISPFVLNPEITREL